MIFKVIVGDVEFTKGFLAKYNAQMNTKFELADIHDWEVTFGSIESNGANNDEILKLSIQYGKSSIRNRIGVYN
jgi:hypothetical protein